MTSHLLYNGQISKVQFSIRGTDDIARDSHVQIRTHDIFQGSSPYPGGVYDANMGTTDYSYKCRTCHNGKRACLGHPGHINLNYVVWNPIAVNEGKKWLKLICFKCGIPVIDDIHYMHFPRAKRLDEASKISRTTSKPCSRCGELHPLIKTDADEPLLIHTKVIDAKVVVSEGVLYPHDVHTILSRISDEVVVKMGKNIKSHPRKFLLTKIEVPPVCIRPDVRKIGGGARSSNDDLTTMMQIIVKKNDQIDPNVINKTRKPAERFDNKLHNMLFELNNAYYDFIKSKAEGGMNSVSKRFKGKGGRARKTQLGKRARNMCRSTIVGDPRIKIDEVGVPLIFARTIQYEEVVQEYNKKQLLQYVMNGTLKYPGVTKIIKRGTNAEYTPDGSHEIELENGDIVLRDMIDGDPVNFNRQPSLMLSNISTHRAKVLLDPTIKTLMMNVLCTPLYNADFDGDQMNLIISASTATRNEISELSSVANWFVSHTTSNPSMGQVDDSIIGTAELTRTDVRFDKYHAMLLCQNTTVIPSFKEVGSGTITGRECVSKLLEPTPINFTRTPEWYKPNLAPYIKYDPSEIKVKIDQGKLVSGILDKKSIGKGVHGSIYHIVANEYGAEKALDLMFNMQQMAISHILQFGFTIGIKDLLVSEKHKQEIDKIGADIINKSNLITEELNNGEIIPPIGKTVEEYFEERQINTLSIYDDFNDVVYNAINPNTNNLFKLINTGSKGKLENMINIMTSIGQKLINGERIRQKFGFKRTLAYFPRFDTSPEARGYITNSYLAGMTPSEYVFGAMAARFDLISKALSTSVTGEQNRKSIKNLESIIINNFRWAVKNRNIIQLAYGEDFLDPRRVEKVKFPTVNLNDKDFKEQFYNEQFPEFFEKMQQDRKKYRDIFFKLENMNIKDLLSDERKMPVEVLRVITDITRMHNESLADVSQTGLTEMIGSVESLCDGIPYVLINEIQEKRKMEIPEYIRSATWLLTMLIRSYLHPTAIIKLRLTPKILTMIINKIRLRYSQALVEAGTAVGIIAAQSFSEPLTQYMLDAHHRSASGGTSKSGMTTTKEILGAKDVEKLSAPSMLIPILPEFATNKAKVHEIANNIEVMKFSQFVIMWQVFFEKFGEPVHTRYTSESNLIADFVKINPLLAPPSDLVKWCIRFVINKTTLILKNMALELIINKLRDLYPDLYIVYTPENAKQIVIRVYMRSTMFKGSITTNHVAEKCESILDTIIRGVEGVISADVVELLRSEVRPDGSIGRKEGLWGITTTGTNLAGMSALKYVDKDQMHSDAIQEMYAMYGVEAARQKIISGMKAIVEICNHRHYTIYADEMTYNGYVTSIESSGLKKREAHNVLLRMGFSSPLATIEEAALNSMEDEVTGITGPLLMGSTPKHGTLYNSYHVNEEFVKKNVKSADAYINMLFD